MVWTGSTTWSESGIGDNHNNAVAFTSGEVAEVFQHDFDQIFGGSFGSAKTYSPTTTPRYNGSQLRSTFRRRTAPWIKSLPWSTQLREASTSPSSFFIDDGLRDDLLAALVRGVTLRGIFDELGAANASSNDEALCADGVQVRIEQTPGKMHNKFIVPAAGADPGVVTGSLNWTAACAEHNSENIVILSYTEAASAHPSAHLRAPVTAHTPPQDTPHTVSSRRPQRNAA